MATKKPFSFEFVINNKEKIVTFIPIDNINNKNIGYFVFYYKDKDLAMINYEIKKRYIIFGMILTLIFLIIYKIFSQKIILTNEVNKQTLKYHEANKQLELNSQELNRLNSSLENNVKNLDSIVKDKTDELVKREHYITAIMNSQTNIVLTTDGKIMKTANKAFFNFLMLKLLMNL